MFTNMCLKNPRLFTSDHSLILGVLPASPSCEHGKYSRARRRFPLRTPQWGPQTRADALYQALKESIPPAEAATRRVRKSWVSDETWRLVDERSALTRTLNHDRAAARRLARRIQAAFRADRKRRAAEAGC